MSTADYDFLVDWNDDGDFSDSGEDITSRVLGTRGGGISFSYGRDVARSIGAIRAGEVEFDVSNASKDYSPDNLSSPLTGLLAPGKAVKIQATFNSTTYSLFRGYLDDYELEPRSQSVHFTALDLLHKLKQAEVSTELYQSIQSGEAVNKLLDAIGWPTADRDIDQGASVLRWWWEDGTDGFEALRRIVDSEGPPAFAFVAPDGKFVFRDRHHRIKRTASTTVQATFTAAGSEPRFSSQGFKYNIGWRDLINQVIIEVQERKPSPLAVVWSTDQPFVLRAGESRVIDIKTNDPFTKAIPPANTSVRQDITFRSGSFSNIVRHLSRTSGQSARLTITATATVVIDKIEMRAQSVPVVRTVKVIRENPSSISTHGVRTASNINPVWANINDADAIARIIVAQRGERLPVVEFEVDNANDTRFTQVLARDLSDRIHLTETAETDVDNDFFIERITHTIDQAGKVHRVQFACERAFVDVSQSPNYFTFDKTGAGFNDGVFGEDSEVPGTGVFILDDSNYGKLDVSGLGF